ncbi:WD40 repeat domain-containing protein [Nonomuraea sp. NPDC050328]|uniref:WD40 repeat domain-containing protein n=1 Tax=Nonomuraea sp. NPDC050328 TaxID=3364361 RepID=UPI0037907752
MAPATPSPVPHVSSWQPPPVDPSDGRSAVLTVGFARMRGQRVAVIGGRDGQVRLWSVPSLEPVGEPFDGVESVVVERNGRSALFVIGKDVGRLWDLDTRRELLRIKGPVSAVTADRERMYVGDRAGRVTIWDLVGLRELGRLTGDPGRPVTALTVAEEVLSVGVGNFGDEPGGVDLWDVAARRKIGEFGAREEAESFNPLQAAVVSGRAVLFGSSMYGLRSWDLHTRRERSEPLKNLGKAIAGLGVPVLHGGR